MTISKSTRFEILRRDEYTCRYCRTKDGELTIDHVIPVALGGTDDPNNLTAACRDCNAGKTSTSPDEGTVAAVSDKALRWKEAMRQAAELMQAERDEAESYLAAFRSAWQSFRRLPGDWEPTIRNFYTAGLPISEVKDAVSIACQTPGVDYRFGYFCGICWRKIRAMQELAQQLLDGNEE